MSIDEQQKQTFSGFRIVSDDRTVRIDFSGQISAGDLKLEGTEPFRKFFLIALKIVDLKFTAASRNVHSSSIRSLLR